MFKCKGMILIQKTSKSNQLYSEIWHTKLTSHIHTYTHTYTLFMLEIHSVAVELISSRK